MLDDSFRPARAAADLQMTPIRRACYHAYRHFLAAASRRYQQALGRKMATPPTLRQPTPQRRHGGNAAEMRLQQQRRRASMPPRQSPNASFAVRLRRRRTPAAADIGMSSR